MKFLIFSFFRELLTVYVLELFFIISYKKIIYFYFHIIRYNKISVILTRPGWFYWNRPKSSKFLISK